MDEPIIQLQNVSKQLGANKVLDGAYLSIYRGEITTIIGKSGVGKSVLLKHIIGLMEPDSGDVLFQGIPISQMKLLPIKNIKFILLAGFPANPDY